MCLWAQSVRRSEGSQFGKGYDFCAETRFDRLFTGVTCPPAPPWVDLGSRLGLEDTTPEDTFDGDYGRLLDRAYEKSVKVLASPRGTDTLQIQIDRWIAA